jgi:hypothetical protein
LKTTVDRLSETYEPETADEFLRAADSKKNDDCPFW